MGIHDVSIDAILAAMPKKKRNQLRQRILRLIDDFNTPPEPGGNVKSLKEMRDKKENGVIQLKR